MKKLAVLSTSAFVLSSLMVAGPALSNDSKRVDVNKATNLERVEADKKAARYTYETMKISFDQNSSKLDADSRKKLREKVMELKRNKDLDQITVAAFSDQDFPPAPDRKLSDRDSELADKRISSVENAFSDIEGMSIDVETFNLAEDANTFEKWFNTADYQLKTALKNNQVVDSSSPRNLRLIKNKAEEGTAIVVFRKRATANTAERVGQEQVDRYNDKMKEERTDVYSE